LLFVSCLIDQKDKKQTKTSSKKQSTL